MYRKSKGHGPQYLLEDRGHDTPCWTWQGGKAKGYGVLSVDGRPRAAHNVYYQRAYGPVPPGLVLDHVCRNRDCVRPEHLEPVTKAENAIRAGACPSRLAPFGFRYAEDEHYDVVERGHDTPCWEWRLARYASGYGLIQRLGKTLAAHRFYYELHKGPIPSNYDLDHLCRNPPCVRPAHLEPVTRAENVRRGARTKLTWATVREIRGLAAANARHSDIAALYGVTRQNVSAIVAGKTWREAA